MAKVTLRLWHPELNYTGRYATSLHNEWAHRVVVVARAVIVGLEAIGAAVGKSRWTVRRWSVVHDFPIARQPGGEWVLTPC